MVHRLTSSKRVLSRVRRSFNPAGTSWIGLAIEMIGEAIEEIGSFNGYVKKSIEITSENFRAPYPSDLVGIRFVEYKGMNLVPSFGRTTMKRNKVGGTSSIYTLADTTQEKYTPLEVTVLKTPCREEYYIPNPDYLVTSFDCDCFTLHYYGLAVDEDGYPMLPDNIHYIQACSWYVLKEMLSSGYKHPVFDWEMADAKFKEKKWEAKIKCKFPSVAQMEAVKIATTRIVPDLHAFERFFEGFDKEDPNI
jgi:hypothetical protein